MTYRIVQQRTFSIAMIGFALAACLSGRMLYLALQGPVPDPTRAAITLALGAVVIAAAGWLGLRGVFLGVTGRDLRADFRAADIPLDRACLIGCGVMTGVGAVINTARVEAGQSVAVFGAGGVGLNVVQGAALVGAHPIIAVDLNDRKLGLAREFGATHVVNGGSADPVGAIQELTGGRGVDVSFEVIGRPEVIVQAFLALRRGGKAVVVGGKSNERGHDAGHPCADGLASLARFLARRHPGWTRAVRVRLRTCGVRGTVGSPARGTCGD